ncbi:MAG TPA: hypothetical protein VGH64_15885 [Puia sp.]|jgi:hypothetical protein
MSEKRFYPIFLAAVSESPVKIKKIRDQYDYDAFYARFGEKPGSLIIEVKTLQAVYLERMSKFDPDINEHSFLHLRDFE